MKITQQHIDYIIRSYVIDKKNTYQISNYLGISREIVSKYLKLNNIEISNQKYKFDEHYFKNIDTANKAYFLGLLYADGCIFLNKNSCAVSLKKEDDYILEKLKNELKSNKPLYVKKETLIKNTNYLSGIHSKLELNSKILTNDLQSLGMTPNKSLTLKFPSFIENKYMKDFIRGYFDGDGCIYNSQNRIMLNFVGSEFFCKELCFWLENNLQIKVIAKKEKRGNSWYFFILKIKEVIKFCEFIYEDKNCLKLNRKYLKYINYINKVEQILKKKKL